MDNTPTPDQLAELEEILNEALEIINDFKHLHGNNCKQQYFDLVARREKLKK